jgi:hypothetical protein
MFTRRHYVAIAATLKATHKPGPVLFETALAFARMLAKDNSRFDAPQFFRACGMGEYDVETYTMHVTSKLTVRGWSDSL